MTSVKVIKPYQEILQPKNDSEFQHRIMIGIPTLGSVRIEWHNALSGLVIPCNWSNSMQSPIGFQVDVAQNIIAQEALDKNFEWLLFIEDDVIVPCDLFIRLSPYLESKKYPIVSGWYNLKGDRPEPLVYRGRGNGPYKNWKPGDQVMADGVPTGCLLVHCSLLRILAETAEDLEIRSNGKRTVVKKIFWTPRMVFTDVALTTYQKLVGTSDLWFCDKLIQNKVLEKAGWKKLAKEKYPFLVDTSIRCGHIDRNSGRVY